MLNSVFRAPFTAQSTLLERDLCWDDATSTLPLAVLKRHIASTFETLDMPLRIRGSLCQLTKEARFERHPDQKLQRGIERLRQLAELGSPAASDNSLYEYLSYQVFALITTLKRAELLEDFIAFIAEPYSLNDLTLFCRQHHLLRAFDLEDSGTVETTEMQQVLDYLDETTLSPAVVADVKVAMRAVARLKSRGRYSAGLAEDLKALSAQRFANIIYLCTLDGSREAWLREGLKEVRDRPFALPLTLRLLQTITSEASRHKVVELVSFPWDRAHKMTLDTFTYLDPNTIVGSIFTAFNFHPELANGLHCLMSIQDRVNVQTLPQRRQRMEKQVQQRPTLFKSVNAQSIALLLKLQPTETSKALAERIQNNAIAVIGLSEQELADLNAARKKRDPNDTGTYASFRIAEEAGQRPALLLPEFGGSFSPREIAFMAHHEGIHLRQAEKYGLQWISENLNTAEMEAWSWDLAFRLMNGEDSFISRFSQLSPLSFALGLQNGLEQIYVRHQQLPT